MFERFTDNARAVVVGAQGEARGLGHTWIGTEHLLLAALIEPAAGVGTALSRLGLTHEKVRAAVAAEIGAGTDDGSALRDLGIDVQEVRRRVEASFGPGALDEPPASEPRRLGRLGLVGRFGRTRSGRPRLGRRPCSGGHIRFTRQAKKSLEQALRESMALRSGEIAAAHILLATMSTDGLAARVVSRLGVAPSDVRRAVLDQLGRAA